MIASSASFLSFKPPLILLNPNKNLNFRNVTPLKSKGGSGRNGVCRAELSQDAPFAVAIGACILNSLVFPVPSGPNDVEGESMIDSADARFAVMGIISFIPYFNWLSWVFAWLDTGKRRYAVYAIVYLAPYLRTNLSLSPEDSWLPIASIIFCIIHIQLEASIKNGDLQGFPLFGGSPQHYSSIKEKKDHNVKGHQKVSNERTEDHRNLPSAEQQSGDEIQGWEVPKKPSQDPAHLNEDGEASD